MKNTRKRLAAGLCPDPLGELKRSPDPLAAIRGPTSKLRGREWRAREGRSREGKGRGTCSKVLGGDRRPWVSVRIGTWL